MPRYYFDVRDGSGYHRDHFGEDFTTLEEAKALAQSLLPDVIREEPPDGDLHAVACNVRDETGRSVYRGELTYRGAQDPV